LGKNINNDLLNRWLAKKDENPVMLLREVGLTELTLYLMRSGKYKSRPKEWTRKKFCEVTGLKERDLFPFVGEL